MAHPPPSLAAALAAKGTALHHVDPPAAKPPAPHADAAHPPPVPGSETHGAASVAGASLPSISAADIAARVSGLRHVQTHGAAASSPPVPHLAPPTTAPVPGTPLLRLEREPKGPFCLYISDFVCGLRWPHLIDGKAPSRASEAQKSSLALFDSLTHPPLLDTTTAIYSTPIN